MESGAAPVFSLHDLWQAYLSCRRRKRGTRDAQRFDQELIDHLVDTRQALADRQWRPRRANWFVTTRPKAREVHCADFADRVVHHWLVPRLEALFEPVFIHDSHSNRVGHGVHRAVDRLQMHIRSASRNGRRPAWYLQLDIANFFGSIDRRRLYVLIRRRIRRLVECRALELEYARGLLWLTGCVLAQQPADRACYIGAPGRQNRVPPHKRLSLAPPGFGLAIGNLPGQLFANIYLNEMDQYIKHQLKIRGYVRYVDDFVLVAPDYQQLIQAREHLIDFLGYVVRPGYRLVRHRVVHHWQEKLTGFRKRLWTRSKRGLALNLPQHEANRLRACSDSYLGHFRHASSWRLTDRILARNPWLQALFSLADGPRLIPRWQPARRDRPAQPMALVSPPVAGLSGLDADRSRGRMLRGPGGAVCGYGRKVRQTGSASTLCTGTELSTARVFECPSGPSSQARGPRLYRRARLPAAWSEAARAAPGLVAKRCRATYLNFEDCLS